MTFLPTKSWIIAALIASPLALGATAASARINVGIGIGIPALVVPAPVVAPPPVVYAQPPVAYAAPPAYYGYGYGAPAVAVGGYWWTDHWGHRHWHRR
jgi:hypothetical protein